MVSLCVSPAVESRIAQWIQDLTDRSTDKVLNLPSELVECSAGVYTFQQNPKYDLPFPPFLAVHPFHHLDERDVHYVKRMMSAIAYYRGAVIALYDEPNFLWGVERHLDLGRTNNTYLIKTRENNPEPLNLDWQGFTNFLRQFNGRPIFLGGGYNGEIYPYYGCLSGAREKLSQNGVLVQTIPELVFDRQFR